MTETMKLNPTIEYLLHERKPFFCPTLETRMICLVPNDIIQSKMSRLRLICGRVNMVKARGSFPAALDNSPPHSIELEPILSESQFDRVISEAQRLGEPVLIVWMASWCRKCIYLKPKLEKLAAEYYPRIRFFHVDVNNVSHKVVARAGVTKMPTIQLWKDGQKEGEVIGGHKPHLVVNEIREMIESENAL